MNLLFLWIAFLSSFAVSSNLLREDRILESHSDETELKIAKEIYEQRIEKTPTDPELYWKLSATCFFLGHRFSSDREEKMVLFEQGVKTSLQGLEINANCAPCHFWYALNTSYLGQTKGIFSSIFALPSVKDHLSQVVELDESYAFAGAYRILGTIYWKIPAILGGDNKLAEKYLQMAIDRQPEPINYLYFTQFALEALNDKNRALQLVTKGLAFSKDSQNKNMIENQESENELKQLLISLQTR